MKIGRLLISAVLVTGLGVATAAASTSNLGTAGATDLRIPVGAMGTSLSGALVGDVTGVDAIFWNPAGIGLGAANQVLLGRMSYFADMHLNAVAYVHRTDGPSSFGVAARILNIGDLIVTTEDMPDGTGEVLSPNFSTVTLSYSRIMTDRVSLGMNFHVKHEEVKDMQATGLLFDFGVRVQTPMPGLRFGVVLKNFGPAMKYDGHGGEFHSVLPGDDPSSDQRVTSIEYAPFDVPSTFQFGLAYDVIKSPRDRFTLMSTFQGNNFSADEYRFGAEYGFADLFFLRFGYVTADQDDYLYTYSAGAGLKMKFGGNELQLDYSYNPMEYFDANQWYTFRFSF